MKTDVPSCTQQDTNALHLIQPFPKCYRHLRELDVAKPGGCTQLGKCSCSTRPGQGLVTSAAASSLYHNVPHPSPAHSPWDLLWKWRLPLSGCHVPWHGPVWHGTAWYGTARHGPPAACAVGWHGAARCHSQAAVQTGAAPAPRAPCLLPVPRPPPVRAHTSQVGSTGMAVATQGLPLPCCSQ